MMVKEVFNKKNFGLTHFFTCVLLVSSHIDAIYAMDFQQQGQRIKKSTQSRNFSNLDLISQFIKNYLELKNKNDSNFLVDEISNAIDQDIRELDWPGKINYIKSLNAQYREMNKEIDEKTNELVEAMFEGKFSMIRDQENKGEYSSQEDLSPEIVSKPIETIQKGSGSKAIIVPNLNLQRDKSLDKSLTEGEILAGGNRTLVDLQKRKLNTGGNCFGFYEKGNFVAGLLEQEKGQEKSSICYGEADFIQKINKTKEIYEAAIAKIKMDAPRQILYKLKNSSITKEVLDVLLTNYLNPHNKKEIIDITGSSVNLEEIQEIKKYMDLSTYVYTDTNTRDFVVNEKVPLFKAWWDDIIFRYDTFMTHYSAITDIISEYNNVFSEKTRQSKKTVTKLGNVSEQTILEDQNKLFIQISEKYKTKIKDINNAYGLELSEEISKRDSTIQILDKLKAPISSEYDFYFSDEEDQTGWFKYFFGAKTIPSYKNRKLTSKAVIASSFLHKSGLKPENVKILDISFRNNILYGGMWNNIMNVLLLPFKGHAGAMFNEGEVDSITYIEKDPKHIRDKLIIVYAGSNSHYDWAIDFTFGEELLFGLSMHKGIGFMFGETAKSYFPKIKDLIESYYSKIPENEKPQNIEIIATGHSLGGGLANLAAYYYKGVMAEKLKESIKLNDVSVKAITFAAPAIISEKTARTFEGALGKNNIYRIWVTNDPVATVTEKVGRGLHVGISIPLYNISGQEVSGFDWWGPHAAERYQSLITSMDQKSLDMNYKNLEIALNNFIKANHLDIYKFNFQELLEMSDRIKEAESIDKMEPIKVTKGLAQHVIKYSPLLQYTPPKTAGDYAEKLHSPRTRALQSPRYTSEEKHRIQEANVWNRFEIKAKFMVSTTPVYYPIRKYQDKFGNYSLDAICAPETIKGFDPRLSGLGEEILSKYACGCCLAKNIFVSNYADDMISFKNPYETLTTMHNHCSEINYCKKEYLENKAGEGNIVNQTISILNDIGLGDKYKEKLLTFENFPKKLELGDILTKAEIYDMISSPESFRTNMDNYVKDDHLLKLRDALAGKEKDINWFITFLNYDEFKSVFSEASQLKMNLEILYDNFVSNIIDLMDSIYQAQLNVYESSRILSGVKKPVKIDEDALKENLQELREGIILEASRKIQEKEGQLQLEYDVNKK